VLNTLEASSSSEKNVHDGFADLRSSIPAIICRVDHQHLEAIISER